MKTLLKTTFTSASALVLLWLVIVPSGCTKKFDEFNTDETKLLNLTPTEYPRLFSRAQAASSFINWRYQYAQNLFGDLYAQYFFMTATYTYDRYIWLSGDLEVPWKVIYTDVVPQLKTLMEETDPASAENALAKIWWAWTFHRNTDYYGPIPYFKAGDPGSSVPYDSQESMYDDFFIKLTEAEAALKANTGAVPYGVFDKIYQGDVS